MNYANTDAEIAAFISTNSVSYRVARVADDSGYTVPMYGTVFAIGRDGRLLWTGNATLVTDEMVESWVATPAAGEDDEEEDGCAADARSSRLPPLAMLITVLVVLGVGRISHRRSTATAVIHHFYGWVRGD